MESGSPSNKSPAPCTIVEFWNEETDWLPDGVGRRVSARPEAANLRLAASYTAERLCAVVHLQGATALLDYAEDFYAGSPALTRHSFGQGTAYYQAAAMGPVFLPR